MKFLIKILLIFAVINVKLTENFVCDGLKSEELNENDIVFFESANFPMLVNETELNKCAITITGTSTKKNMYLILVITNGYITNAKVDRGENDIRDVTKKDIYHFTNFTNNESLKFYFVHRVSKSFEAFQGFITYQKRTTNTCLLSGKKEPYEFKKENETYYLRSSFEDLDKTKNYQQRKCLWRFVSLPNYGIKVEALDINYFTAKLHVVTDNIREVITGPTTKYYNDSKIAISYNAKDEMFEAKISIYKLPIPESQDYCIYNNETLIWETGPMITYGFSVHCWKTIEILPNQELKITLTNYIFNETGNFLQFYTDGDNFFPFRLSENREYVFLPYRNNTARKITFEFKSSENVINQKFKMKFEIIARNAKKDTGFDVTCEENIPFIYSIMDRDDHFYCAHHECIFEVITNRSCPNRHILLEASMENNGKRYDNFTVYSDDEEMISIVNVSFIVEDHKNHEAIILPHRKTVLYFKSEYDTLAEFLDVVKLAFTLTSFKEPNRSSNIIFFDNLPLIHNLEFPPHSITTVNLPEYSIEDSYLELNYDPKKTSKLNCIIIYRNENLSSKILIHSPFLNVGKSVTIYNHQKCAKNNILFVIKMQKKNGNGCLMKNTTLYTGGNKPITMIAGQEKSCEIVILNSASGNVIEKLWTNSKTQNIILYSYSNKKQELFQFNQNTLNVYGKMTFNSRIYIVTIPANKSVLIELSENSFFNKPMKSYYETKNYGTFYATKTKKSVTNYKISKNIEVNFTVADFHLSKNGNLQIIHGNQKKDFNSNNTFFTAKGKDDTNLAIYFRDSEVGYRGALIKIEVHQTHNTFSTEKSTQTYISTIGQKIVETFTVTSNSCFCEISFVLFFIKILFLV